MDLGDRMKEYEKTSDHKLINRSPVILRLDGRAFHTLTRKMPTFHEPLREAMLGAAKRVYSEIDGAVVAYHQSDEISFLILNDKKENTSPWLGNRIQKLCSLSASIAAVSFSKKMDVEAHFDARVFNIPESEIANYFLWRVQDATRNSIQSYARMYFSQAQLNKKSQKQMQDMFHEIGKNWAKDLKPYWKNGTFIFKVNGLWVPSDRTEASYEKVNKVVCYGRDIYYKET